MQIGHMRNWTTFMQALRGYQSASVGMAALAWRPGASHTLASASFEGTLSLWDIRSAMPLATVEAHDGKALALCWRGPNALASGGSDANVRIFQVPDAGFSVAKAEA